MGKSVRIFFSVSMSVLLLHQVRSSFLRRDNAPDILFSTAFTNHIKPVAPVAAMGEPGEDRGSAGLHDCRVNLTESYRFDEKSGIPRLSRFVNLGKADEVLELLKAESTEQRADDHKSAYFDIFKQLHPSSLDICSNQI